MLHLPTARKFNPPRLPQDQLTSIPTTCWRCGPKALATPWLSLELFARHHHTPTPNITPEQHQWWHMHFEPAPDNALATVTWMPDTTAGGCIQRATFHTKHPAPTYPVLAKHDSTTPDAPFFFFFEIQSPLHRATCPREG